jgi:S-DNA-T family DNA segregation ATPase FtsK/SpoIIIE
MSISAADIFRPGLSLSMFDPVYVGIDEFRMPVRMRLIYKNLLAAGLPGGGKSSLLNNLVAHAALSELSRLVLFDAKKVELGMWDDVADEFVGPDMDKAIITMLRLQKVLNNRCDWLYARRRREVRPDDGLSVINIVFDELFIYSATLGTKEQRELFITLLRDLVGRGRFAAMPVLAATQRPSIDIIPKSLRDLFGYRAAFRCTSMGSSDIILGDGWAAQGFDATTIRDTQQGVAYLIAEDSTPQLIKAAYLSDADIIALADYAAWIRGKRPFTSAAATLTAAS